MIETLKSTTRRRTVAEVVRDALQLYDWCRRQVADGFVIAAVKGEKTREVVLPFELAPVPAVKSGVHKCYAGHTWDGPADSPCPFPGCGRPCVTCRVVNGTV